MLDLCLYIANLLHPVYALIVSIHLICGWILQLSWWTVCELDPFILGDGPDIGCLNNSQRIAVRVSAGKVGCTAGLVVL